MQHYELSWAQLGWWPFGSDRAGRAPPSLPGIHPGDRVAFLVVAPWCPDCQELVPAMILDGFAEQALPGKTWLVGEFAPERAVAEFARERELHWPLLCGTQEKTEIARMEARFASVRRAFGDTRYWGLPTYIEAVVQPGGSSFLIDTVTWPE